MHGPLLNPFPQKPVGCHCWPIQQRIRKPGSTGSRTGVTKSQEPVTLGYHRLLNSQCRGTRGNCEKHQPGSTGSRTGVTKSQEVVTLGCHWLLASQCRSNRVDCEKHRPTNSRHHPVHRPAFTLVELLITITIIGILAAGVLGALQVTREQAKASKTKATITKLHYVIMARYDAYRTRRVPIATNPDDPQTTVAQNRLNALRDLIRMEMPDRLSDLGVLLPTNVLTKKPSITERYLRLYNERDTDKDDSEFNHPSAELLYMIVMSIPEAAEQFHNTEIGDSDGDGLPEFVDGWGHPIKFIRWPVGFLKDDSTIFGDTITHGAISDLQTGNIQEEPDPFDPMRVGSGFAVFPLVYSAGPDGKYDINTGYESDNINGYEYGLDVNGNLNPFVKDADGNGYYIGQPLHRNNGVPETPDSANLFHYDNIHNHRLEVR